MYPKLPNVELSGGRSGEDVAWLRPPRSRRRTVLGLNKGRFCRQRSEARASGCERDPSRPPKRGHARFQKEEKDDSRPQPEARARSSKSPKNFVYHTTTLLLGLSIRKSTEFRPKSPVFLLFEGQKGFTNKSHLLNPGGFAFARMREDTTHKLPVRSYPNYC